MYSVQIWKTGDDEGWYRIAWDIESKDEAIEFANERNNRTKGREQIRVRHTNKFGNVTTILELNGPNS